MPLIERLAWTLLVAIVGAGAIALFLAARQEFPGCPPDLVIEDHIKETIATLTDIVKWGIGISAGAAGLFGSQLLKMKDAPQYSQAGRLMLVGVVIGMCMSTYFGLRWRSLVAQAWFLRCPKLIAQPFVQASFDYHHYFLAGALGVLALMALLLSFPTRKA